MKKIISLLTLKAFSVSIHRKRIFILTLIILAALIVTPQLSFKITFPLPYTVEFLRLGTLVIAGNVFANIVRIFVVSNHRKRRGISTREKDNFTVGVNALVNAATVLIFIASFFFVFNIALQSFLSSFALFAVAFTLIFIDFIKSFLYGLTMMFSADYEIGDYIQIGEMPKGVITNITFSAVQLKTETGDILFVPNALIRAHEVVNFSKLKPKRITTEFSLLRTQIESVELFEQKLTPHLSASFPSIFELEKVSLRIIKTDKDVITFLLEVPTKKASLNLKEKVNDVIQKFAIGFSVDV